MTIIMDMWTNFSEGFFQFGPDAYSSLEPWTFPLIFMGVIGYVFMATHSVSAAVVSILLTLGIYATTTNIFVNVPDISLFLYLVTLIGLSLLIMILVLKVVDRI